MGYTFTLDFTQIKQFMDKYYGIKILLVIIVIFFLTKFSQHLLHKFFEKTGFLNEEDKDKMKQAKTFENIWKATSNSIGIIIAVIVIFSEIGIDVSKIVAVSSVITVVAGFSMQNIFKDAQRGFDIFGGKHIRNGDSVTIVTTKDKYDGIVEEVGIRFLKLRLSDGKLLVTPNSEVKELMNGNAGKRRVSEKIIITFREDPKKVIEVLQIVCDKLNVSCEEYLKKDEEGKPIEKFEVQAISTLGTSTMGYEYGISGLVCDKKYMDAVKIVRLTLAQELYDKNIKLAEQNVFYQTRLTSNQQ